MNWLRQLFSLFYPQLCLTCYQHLVGDEVVVCSHCRFDLPLMDNGNFKKNEITQIFEGRSPINKAGAFFYFKKEGKIKKLIHQLKYKGHQEIGDFFGNWIGTSLKDSGVLNDIDLIIPVPLHPKRERNRGYNQLTKFGTTLGLILNKPLNTTSLIRINNTQTQTYKNRLERFRNKDSKFHLINTTEIENKHVLLIDDVLTTGATLESCCIELQKAKGIRISILTIAYTE